MIEQITSMLSRCASKNTLFPPTDLYNETWMLRLIFNWFSQHPSVDHHLSFQDDSICFSEALLPSTFLPRYRGDKYSESWTHADGVIGQFEIGNQGRVDLSLKKNATQLVVCEAKMFSRLSSRTINAPYYNQAARSVACFAEVLKRAKRHLKDLKKAGFYVIAPKEQIQNNVFGDFISPSYIRHIVEKRVREYDEPKDKWFKDWFIPTIENIDIRTICWEEIIIFINSIDHVYGESLESFYDHCLEFNRRTEDRNAN